MTVFFQVGNVMAFLKGVYDSDFSFAELAKKGDFGLGTFNRVDGEMVALDGTFYRIDGDGNACEASPSLCTPFSVVSNFEQVPAIPINNVSSLADLNKLLDTYIPTPNIFYMIRIDGVFDSVSLRSEACQPQPYSPLSETLPKLQKSFEVTDSVGTLVVTRCPAYSGGCTIPGYHYHYIDDAKQTGGHVFNLKLKSAQVMINPIRHFEMAVQDSPEFDAVDLDIDMAAALKKIE